MVKIPTLRPRVNTAPAKIPTLRVKPKVAVEPPPPKVPQREAVNKEPDTEHPPLYETLSLLGLLMASMRAQEWGYFDLALKYVPGFIRDLAKYKIPFPAKELEAVRHYTHMERWDNAYAALQAFSRAFGPELRKAVMKDHTVKAGAVSALGTCLDMLAARNPNRWGQLENTLVTKFKYINNPDLVRFWRVKEQEVKDEDVNTLGGIVNLARSKLKAKPGEDDDPYTLSFDQRKQLRKIDPELTDKYNKAYNGMIKKYRAALRNYVLDHDNKPQPVPQAREAMEEKGFHINDMQTALDPLFIGSDGFFYTTSGLKILQRPQPGTTILKFNPEYDPDDVNGGQWVFQYRTDEGEPIYAYTEVHKQHSKVVKNEHIMQNIDKAIAMRPRWVRDLEQSGDERKELPALVVDLIYWTCGRIGSVGNSVRDFGNTYGLSTLLVKQVQISAGKVVLEYHGKDAVLQVHTLSTTNKDQKLLAQCIKALCKGKKPDDPVFTYSNGKPLSADQVRAYMRSINLPIKPHDFRSIRGTKLMDGLLSKLPEKTFKGLSFEDAQKLFKETAVEVGKLLGHVAGGKVTANTALSSYIMPEFSREWFAGHGYRVPLWVSKLTGDD